MKRNTIAKDFEAKQASVAAAGEMERAGSELPLTGTIVGVPSVANADWASVASETFASKDEVGELRQVVALKVRHKSPDCSYFETSLECKWKTHLIKSLAEQTLNAYCNI